MDEYNSSTSEEQITYLAYCGMLQWTHGCIEQGARLGAQFAEDHRQMLARFNSPNALGAAEQTAARTQIHTQSHFFAVAAHKVIEHKRWVKRRGIFRKVDFSPLDEFRELDVKDLRDMGEHRVEYFSGKGDKRDRWVKTTDDFISDASSIVGPLLGGRLDWQRFAAACQAVLPELLAEPAPYPTSIVDWLKERAALGATSDSDAGSSAEADH